jgi:hypothetical protein
MLGARGGDVRDDVRDRGEGAVKREEKSMKRRAGRPRNYTLLFNVGFLKR